MHSNPSASERWRRVEALYHLALERPQNQRAAFLDDQCGTDEHLRREVESLLGYTADAEDFMEHPAAGETFVDESENLEGRELGSYKVISLLGMGGMGKVYLAKDTRLERTVAIKVLASEKMADAERKRRFLQEARAASALLEVLGHQLVPTQQLVEIGAVALGQARGLADVAAGDLQDLRQVAARKFIARLVKRGQPTRRAAEGLLYQFHGDDRCL